MVDDSLCAFCQEFKDVEKSEFRREIPKSISQNRIVESTDNFVALAGLGGIRPGYILIIPKNHMMSFAFLNKKDVVEVQQLKHSVIRLVESLFARPIVFEHGSVSQALCAGNTIAHAHLHVFPTDVDLFPRLAKDFEYRSIDCLQDLSYFRRSQESYLYYERAGRGFGFTVHRSLPLQYLRRLIWDQEGKPDEWDWQIFKGTDSLIETMKALRSNERDVL